MLMDSIWINILSSAGVASIISACASYAINALMQKRKYKDDYYKMVVEKRMDAYRKRLADEAAATQKPSDVAEAED